MTPSDTWSNRLDSTPGTGFTAGGASRSRADGGRPSLGGLSTVLRAEGDIQAVRHKLSEMHANTQAGRLLTYDAARQLDDGTPPSLAASTAKYFASEAAMDVTNEAVQIHGGYGYTTEYPVERLYRDAKITTIYEGTTQIQKKVIARELLD